MTRDVGHMLGIETCTNIQDTIEWQTQQLAALSAPTKRHATRREKHESRLHCLLVACSLECVQQRRQAGTFTLFTVLHHQTLHNWLPNKTLIIPCHAWCLQARKHSCSYLSYVFKLRWGASRCGRRTFLTRPSHRGTGRETRCRRT